MACDLWFREIHHSLFFFGSEEEYWRTTLPNSVKAAPQDTHHLPFCVAEWQVSETLQLTSLPSIKHPTRCLRRAGPGLPLLGKKAP